MSATNLWKSFLLENKTILLHIIIVLIILYSNIVKT